MSEEMTREQAIQIVSEIRDIDGFPLDDKKALNMAIAALSAESCEDAISRQSALESFHYLPMYSVETKDGQHKSAWVCDGVWAKISLLPSVHAEPRTGHWIKSEGGIACSECGNEENSESYYCPWCGADMREDSDV